MSFLKENRAKRNEYFPVRGKALKLPIYFPSISSIKTGLSPFDYFNVLRALQQPHFLVSAFDIAKSCQRTDFLKALKKNHKEDGSIILMDSGNYESYWIRDKEWAVEDFNEILTQEVSDLAFCFDNQFPPLAPNKNAEWIAKSTRKSQEVANTTSIIPIVHCKKDDLNETVVKIYDQMNFTMVAIPERILGDGLVERVKTITNLRRELNKLDNYTFIHLLGTGNPFSLLLFSLAGVDSFDGLEWCQTTVNSQTALLYHFQQRELIRDNCDFCNTADLDYVSATLGHNLTFYNSWMKNIQNTMEGHSEIDLLKLYFDSNFVSEINTIWS